MTSPWWAAFGPADYQVRCGAGLHRLLWADGALRPADHADADGELVIVALGGRATPCLELVRVWDRHCDDLSVLAVGPRSADDQLTLSAEAIAELMPVPTFIQPIPVPDEHAEVPALMALGQPFQFGLSGAVAHAWSADGEHAGGLAEAWPTLTAALAGRFAPVAAQWLGIDPDDVETSIHPGSGWGAIELTGSAGGQTLRGALPVSWLARVWAPGLGLVGGHLVVSVLQAAWPVAQVLALDRPGASPVELRLRHTAGAWSVAA
jgi:hypothetical protein